MPTLPPEQPQPTLPSVAESHQARQIAESFGTDAERYDRARPRYPAGLIERIVGASQGPDVLDVGCGTGIVARQLRAAGCRVLGVEPDARMADLARTHGIEVEIGTIETWDPAGRSFDAVTAGQAWHWIDPVAGAAKAARVLRPGGLLAVFWNAFQAPAEIAPALTEAYRAALPNLPSNPFPNSDAEPYGPLRVKAADGIREVSGFGEPAEWRFDWDKKYTRDEWLDMVPTSGGMSRVPAETQEKLLAKIGAAIDRLGGSFTMHYATVVVTATRDKTS